MLDQRRETDALIIRLYEQERDVLTRQRYAWERQRDRVQAHIKAAPSETYTYTYALARQQADAELRRITSRVNHINSVLDRINGG